MFSAHDYLTERYASTAIEPAKEVVLGLQQVVDAAGLTDHDALVETMLNVLVSVPLAQRQLEIVRTWLQWAAAVRALDGPWEQELMHYVNGPGKDQGVSAADFYKQCMDSGTASFRRVEESGFDQFKPIVLIGQPTIRKAVMSGVKANVGYSNQEDVTIGFGLFEVMAGLRTLPGTHLALKLGIVQYATADRVATYDGMEVRRQFTDALDCGTKERPWLTGVSEFVSTKDTAVGIRDAPKWSVPLQRQNHKLIGVDINDKYTTHVVAKVSTKYFKLYTCEWTFKAAYNVQDPDAATHEYEITSEGPSSGELTFTGNEVLANSFKDVEV